MLKSYFNHFNRLRTCVPLVGPQLTAAIHWAAQCYCSRATGDGGHWLAGQSKAAKDSEGQRHLKLLQLNGPLIWQLIVEASNALLNEGNPIFDREQLLPETPDGAVRTNRRPEAWDDVG
jgi:hypothetical protein